MSASDVTCTYSLSSLTTLATMVSMLRCDETFPLHCAPQHLSIGTFLLGGSVGFAGCLLTENVTSNTGSLHLMLDTKATYTTLDTLSKLSDIDHYMLSCDDSKVVILAFRSGATTHVRRAVIHQVEVSTLASDMEAFPTNESDFLNPLRLEYGQDVLQLPLQEFAQAVQSCKKEEWTLSFKEGRVCLATQHGALSSMEVMLSHHDTHHESSHDVSYDASHDESSHETRSDDASSKRIGPYQASFTPAVSSSIYSFLKLVTVDCVKTSKVTKKRKVDEDMIEVGMKNGYPLRLLYKTTTLHACLFASNKL
jgi:hypothetical protein